MGRCAHRTGLGLLVRARGERRSDTAGELGPETLADTFRHLGDDRVGQSQDGTGRAVVLLQRHRGRAGEVGGEIEDVAHGGCAEGVDGLGVVSHRGDPGSVGTEERDDHIGLEHVGVLILVDQHVIEPLRQDRTDRRVANRGTPVQQEILEIEEVLGPLTVGVPGEHRPQPLDVVQTPREEPCHRLLQRHLSAHHPAVQRGHGLHSWEPVPAAGGDGRPDQGHQVAGITLVEHAEPLGQTEGRAVPAEHAMGDRVEGPGHHPGGQERFGEKSDPVQQLGRGPTAEGDQEHARSGSTPSSRSRAKSAHQGPGLPLPRPAGRQRGQAGPRRGRRPPSGPG